MDRHVLFGIVSALYFWFVVTAKDGNYSLFNHTISSYICFCLSAVQHQASSNSCIFTARKSKYTSNKSLS